MFRFLLAEDEEQTLEELKVLLLEEFEGSVVDTAGSVAEGLQRLVTSLKEGKPYDAALLDFRLPSSPGENPEFDFSLCEHIRKNSPRTLIIHITSHGKVQAVLDHLAESHGEPHGPWPVFVSKAEADWTSVLLRRLKTSLIAIQMDDVFGYPPATLPAGDGSGLATAFRRSTARTAGVTHRLAVLMQNIEAHWPDLSETLKERILATFVVDAAGDEVRVSLL